MLYSYLVITALCLVLSAVRLKHQERVRYFDITQTILFSFVPILNIYFLYKQITNDYK